LMYTSGTSGEPKSVMRSHANVLAAAQNAQRGFGYLGNDIMAIVMPLSHSSALTSQMVPLIAQGGTLVLLERFDIKDLLRTIRAEQVTCLRAVPAMLRLLLTTPEFCADHLPSLRLLMNSSASIDPATLNEVKRRFPTIEIVNSYGLTEASTCTMLPDAAIVTRPDSVGRPIDGIDMSVMDETGNPVEDGVEGEICVRGAHVFAGYRNRPEETDTAFRAGWFRTGDIGHRDAEGFYYLHGRLGEYINCGGRTFSAAEVEQCVLRVPDVSEAAVIAIAHRVLGHVAKAFVVPRQGAHPNPKTIINHCTRHLPSFKVPFSVKIVSEIPKSSTGKTLHRKLKEAAHD
jgi:long-chain acyl-CoA synthetase